MLEPDESVLFLFKTTLGVMKKYVLFTQTRLVVSSVLEPGKEAQSIPYRSVTSFAKSDFLGVKNITVNVAGRDDELKLYFESDEDSASILSILQTHAL
jgi:hypothetical protein